MKYFEKIAVGPRIIPWKKMIEARKELGLSTFGLRFAKGVAFGSGDISIKAKKGTKEYRKILRHELTHIIRDNKGLDRNRNFIGDVKAESAAYYGMQPRSRNKIVRNILGGIGGTSQALVQHPLVSVPLSMGIGTAIGTTLRKLDESKNNK